MEDNPYAPPSARDDSPDRHPIRDGLRFLGLVLMGSGLMMGAVGMFVLTADQWRARDQFQEGHWYAPWLFLGGVASAWIGKALRDAATPGAWREPTDGSVRVPTSVGFLVMAALILAAVMAAVVRR